MSSDLAPPSYPYYLFFDVESVGLHGEGFAVGYVVIADGRSEHSPVRRRVVASGCFATSPDSAHGEAENLTWVRQNVPPLPHTHNSTHAVRDAFWTLWREWVLRGAALVADCGWPVEARFLIACIFDDPSRAWDGPYPLHEVASLRCAAGLPPTGGDERFEERLPEELPVHHPQADAQRSARAWFEALDALRAVRP